MSVRVEPKGKDRSLNKSKYKLLNKIVKKIEYENRAETQEAVMQQMLYGQSVIEINSDGKMKCLKGVFKG